MIDDNLVEAYLTAKYIVEYNNEEHRIWIGERPEFVKTLLVQHKVRNTYFITPENPFSCALTIEENMLRHARFMKELNHHQYFYLPGYGTDEAETWPKESSYLIFTDNESAVHNLAARFGQNAFLKISINLPVQLLILQQPQYVRR